ncbi:CsgG/HfaB family protein [Hoeflea ulvae]|uniref:Curlin n=1 Tax=Hoeflea ulvae TaxID=2983764 RepID=A0ABT3YDS1_9HYPH|nr:CsgG/HfaB family protein [Hoeflea ulvae]MCY0094040.1 curlin [Hoeflea ulvae]
MNRFREARITVLRGARVAAVLLAAAGLSACVSTPDEGMVEASFTPVTKQNNVLRALPAPTKRISVAVYDFPDLTGQFKERENVQSLSKAVTQGGAAMLIKALQDAGERRWFTVLDRASLNDLLKERQIVTEMRKVYRNEQSIDPNALAPLRHAGIVLQGGIIGYDTNTQTGGLGARYLGIGADAKWKQDTVTVTLRAVSTNTGEVLASVTVHKIIASYSLQAGVFRYITLDSILEGEAGVTRNEPDQIAVQQAVEKAIVGLIAEGADLGIWSFADKEAGARFVDAYLSEKYDGEVPVAALDTPRPETKHAAAVVETTPRRSSPVRAQPARVVRPAAAKPTAQSAKPGAQAPQNLLPPELPPAPASDETVG